VKKAAKAARVGNTVYRSSGRDTKGVGRQRIGRALQSVTQAPDGRPFAIRPMTPSLRSRRLATIFVWLVACSSVGSSREAAAASVAPVAAEHGMVVTAQHLATEVGVDVLKKGGNAIDAAVAVGYALAVVYPAAGNLGGGGFMTIQLADGRKTFLDFREKAPLAATPDMYLDAAGNVIKGSTTMGYLAVAVPGTVSGLEMALARYGTMSRAEVMAPAIRYAEQGFVLDQGDAEMFARASAAFRADPATAAIFLDNGKLYSAGDRLVQHDLAHTLARERAHFLEHRIEAATDFIAARIGHDAEAAILAAALHDRDVSARALGARLGQRIEFLDLGEAHIDHRACVPLELIDHLRQPMKGLGAEHQIHERRARDDGLALLARHAAADPDDERRSLRFELPPLPEQRVHLVLRLLAHRAGVHEQHIGLRRIVGGIEAHSGA